jgi:hypothetical protein
MQILCSGQYPALVSSARCANPSCAPNVHFALFLLSMCIVSCDGVSHIHNNAYEFLTRMKWLVCVPKSSGSCIYVMSTSTNQGNLSKRDCQTLQGVLKVKHKVTAQKDNIKKLQFSKCKKWMHILKYLLWTSMKTILILHKGHFMTILDRNWFGMQIAPIPRCTSLHYA